MPEKSKIYSGRLGKGKSVFSIPSLYKDQKWVAYSKKFLSINKKCYACGEKSQATDHWRAHKNRKEFFWNPNNMLPLCFNCHNFVSSTFDRFNPPKTKEKLEWINEKREELNISFKVMFVSMDLESGSKKYTRKKEFIDEENPS